MWTLREKYMALGTLLLFIGITFSSPGFATIQSEIVVGPYTQNATYDSITVVWETSTQTDNNSVEYGENSSYGYYICESSSSYHHEITISPPFTSGHYRVISDEEKSNDFEFELASNCLITKQFKCVIFGDSRGAWDNWMHAKEVANAVNAESPNFVIHGGDMVGDGTSQEQWNKWLELTMPLMQNSTLFGVLGNHELNGSRYYQIFSLPNNEMWYSFDYGSCHFIVLDNYAPWGVNSAQYKWLKNDLSSTTKPFKIVCFHEPIYCSGGHNPRFDVRAIWEPLFKRYDVNLVFQSHNHYYQRTEPIEGVTYIVTGGAGAPLYNPENASFINNSKKAYHYCVLNISLSKMEITYSAKYINGTSFDEFTINSPSMLNIEIVKPEGGLYIFDKKIMPLLPVIIIGKIDIEAAAASYGEIGNVGFYIDGSLEYEDVEAPYEWLWNDHSIGRHEIKVIAHNRDGNTASDEQKVWILNLQ